GNYVITGFDPGTYSVKVEFVGYSPIQIDGIVVGTNTIPLDIEMLEGELIEEVVVIAYEVPMIEADNTSSGQTLDMGRSRPSRSSSSSWTPRSKKSKKQQSQQQTIISTETYSKIAENDFHATQKEPLSTFSIDVDKAAYANVRRMLNQGQKPPKNAVKVEEMINYFDYDYAQPENGAVFSLNTELGACPWNADHHLLHIGIQGKDLTSEERVPNNLVFLLDVSGSMGSANKLPLVKSSLKLLLEKLDDEDQVSMVVYAGAAGVVLHPTKVAKKEKIFNAIDRLESGGSTAGGQGIEMAYELAAKHFLPEGNNRVILATDGDFNVGISNTTELQDLIEAKRESGIYLTCLGYGMGNYRDDMLETLAQKGNGNHAYIDSMQEAYLILGKEIMGTLFAIAKDVKIQIEFNPAHVQEYRLIGYENRLLETEDFLDDKKDAAELGAGHTVTAIYEIIPTGLETKRKQKVHNLKYQQVDLKTVPGLDEELAQLRVRYKPIKETESVEVVKVITTAPVSAEATSDDFRFSASVVMFGMLLRDSKFKGTTNKSAILKMAKTAIGDDPDGYRAEFLRLVHGFTL
ncbi:MAG: von Willebrand factor type A domain-containing protein, partial [Bacteroidota bacterium]